MANDTAVKRRAHEGAQRPRRPSAFNGGLASCSSRNDHSFVFLKVGFRHDRETRESQVLERESADNLSGGPRKNRGPNGSVGRGHQQIWPAVHIRVESEKSTLGRQAPGVRTIRWQLRCEPRSGRSRRGHNCGDCMVMRFDIAQERRRSITTSGGAEESDMTFGIAGQPVEFKPKYLFCGLRSHGSAQRYWRSAAGARGSPKGDRRARPAATAVWVDRSVS